MAIGRRRPARTVSETTAPITSGITQAISTAAPGVISPQATPTAAQPIAPTGTTPNLTAIGQEQQITTSPIEVPVGGISSVPPGAADQAGDMMPVTTATGTRSNIGFGGRPAGSTYDRPATVLPGEMPATPETPAAVPGVGELVGQFQEQAEAARAANEARYAQGLGIHEQLVGDFGAGGTMEAAAMDRYQRQKSQDIAGQMQQAVSSGMYGTTRPSTYGTAYEQQVGTPYKLGLAEAMAQRKAEAMRGQAGFIERREDIPPSPELMASLVQTASARPEEDAAAGVTEEAAPTSLWGSGQTGAITAAQFSTEAQRQQFSKTYTAQVSAYETQIKQYEDAAKRFDPGSPQQVHYTNVIKTLRDQLKTAKEKVEEYGEEKAKISSVQYAEEEQRRAGSSEETSGIQVGDPGYDASMRAAGFTMLGGRWQQNVRAGVSR